MLFESLKINGSFNHLTIIYEGLSTDIPKNYVKKNTLPHFPDSVFILLFFQDFIKQYFGENLFL